jgi:flagellar hook-length control protein FliK
MLPTLPIPAAVRVEPPSSSQANASDAANGDGDGFACVLQRAQGWPTATVAAAANEPRVTLPRGGEPQGKAVRHDDAKPGVRAGGKGHDVDRPRVGNHDRHDADARDDTSTIDPKALIGGADQPKDDSPKGTASPATPTPSGETPTWPPLAIDTVLQPHIGHDVARGTTVSVPADSADDALAASSAIEHRTPAASRFTLRMGGAHDARVTAPGAANPTADAARGGEPQGPTASPRGDDLRATIESTAAAIASTRAPIGERAAVDTVATAAAAVAASNGTEGTQGHDKVNGPPREATLHAAIDEAGFGDALGGQVALWVREGVQEARLQLHPAELGPVNVQIALDGQLAHVDFVAAVPATRESIEQSLPALAAALRDAGFTLAGGGVSGQGAHGGRNGQRDGAGREFGTQAVTADDDATTPLAPRRWNRSLVDVYA